MEGRGTNVSPTRGSRRRSGAPTTPGSKGKETLSKGDILVSKARREKQRVKGESPAQRRGVGGQGDVRAGPRSAVPRGALLRIPTPAPPAASALRSLRPLAAPPLPPPLATIARNHSPDLSLPSLPCHRGPPRSPGPKIGEAERDRDRLRRYPRCGAGTRSATRTSGVSKVISTWAASGPPRRSSTATTRACRRHSPLDLHPLSLHPLSLHPRLLSFAIRIFGAVRVLKSLHEHPRLHNIEAK